MIDGGQDSAPTDLRQIGAEWSIECARLHAASFALPWPATDFEQLLAAREAMSVGVVEAEGSSLAGFVLSRFAADEAEILTIAVPPERRRRGIGKALLAAHLAGLTALGVTRLFLEVDAENGAARALYARFGFCQVGAREAYYRGENGTRTSALVLRADLG